MNGSMLKQQKKIKELNDKVESLKAVERPPMPDRSYQLLIQQNQELKDELEFYKRKSSHASRYILNSSTSPPLSG